MPFQVIPRQQAFFDLIEQSAQKVDEGARELRSFLNDFSAGTDRGERVKDLEREGDHITQSILELLNTSFVTPLDRDDIYRLASRLDDVLDSQEAVVELLALHRIEEPLPELRQQADVLARTTETLQKAVRRLRSLRDIERDLIEINRLENEGDRVYRKTVARLYSGEFKAMDVLRWKDIVDEMEKAIDACEDIANTIESITLKHA